MYLMQFTFCDPKEKTADTIRNPRVSAVGNEYEGARGIVDRGIWTTPVLPMLASTSRLVGLGLTFTGGGLLILLRSKHKITQPAHDTQVVVGFYICIDGVCIGKDHCRIVRVLNNGQDLVGRVQGKLAWRNDDWIRA